ncbi:uncharacterized protein METZ01_LOCUS229048 [marine metagenome]|uniref:Uncharacterized protein n=1 Tax=marine metagenome TaxID=408172 RepID=A0A382GN28_9ZZZZ
MKILFLTTVAALIIMGAPGQSNAHHSVFAVYDINKSVTIDGVITDVWFKSPHIRVFVEVTDKDGTKVTWNTHGHNPTALRRRGWVRDTLEVGEKVTMSGDPTYDGSPKMFIRTIVREDGSILENKVGN